MAEETPTPQPAPAPQSDVIAKRGIDVNTIFSGVAAVSSAASAGAAWYAVTHQSSPPEQSPPAATPTIELPPGVDRGQEAS